MTDEYRDQTPESPRVRAYTQSLDDYTKDLMSKVGELRGLGLKGLLARGKRLLEHHHALDRGFEHPHSMLDSEDVLDLYIRAARIRQVEMALGMVLIEGSDIEMGDEARDAICTRVGWNLIGLYHADLIADQNREIELCC